MLYVISKAVTCATRTTAYYQRMQSYLTLVFNYVKGEFVRLVTWLSVIGG